MRIRLNSDVDGLEVLGPRTFYYGLDGQPGADIDFVTAALHEIAHGLGFLPLANLNTGALASCSAEPTLGCSDAFVDNLRDEAIAPPDLADMDDAQRSTAARDEPNLVWSGTAARGAGAGLTSGTDGEDRVIMHAPSEFTTAVSVTHVTTAVSPSQLMEPSYSGANHVLDLAALMLRDTGWLLTSDTTTTTTTSTTTSTSLPEQSGCGDPSVTTSPWCARDTVDPRLPLEPVPRYLAGVHRGCNREGVSTMTMQQWKRTATMAIAICALSTAAGQAAPVASGSNPPASDPGVAHCPVEPPALFAQAGVRTRPNMTVYGAQSLDMKDDGYNSSYMFGMTRGVSGSAMHPGVKPLFFLFTIPLDIVLLPFAAIGGFF